MVYNFVDSETDRVHMYAIKQDNTTKNKWYCVMQNPFKTEHDRKVIYGGSEEIVGRKIEKQFKKFKESAK